MDGLGGATPSALGARGCDALNESFLGEEKQSLQKVFQLIRADRLLVETDAPSMPLPESIQEFSLPLSASGERLNHPGNLRTSYRALAEIRGITEQRLMQIVSENFARLFGKLLK